MMRFITIPSTFSFYFNTKSPFDLKSVEKEKLTRKLHDLFVSHQVQLVKNGIVLCEIFILVLLLFPAKY